MVVSVYYKHVILFVSWTGSLEPSLQARLLMLNG